jgi:pyridoxine 5-phosphate synthase
MFKIRLGINIDHAATLRQVRGGTTAYPDLVKLAKLALKSGADQITIHLREDRRHIQDFDLKNLSKAKIPLNLEMAATEAMLKNALKYKPLWVCFVPEKRAELTTEGGLNVSQNQAKLKSMIKALHQKGIQVSMFIDPSLEQVKASHLIGADACEFHTGTWVHQNSKSEWKRLVQSAKLCHQYGMNVHAGHGLDYDFTRKIKKLPYLQEVNIGHSVICYSLFEGLAKTVKQFNKILR